MAAHGGSDRFKFLLSQLAEQYAEDVAKAHSTAAAVAAAAVTAQDPPAVEEPPVITAEVGQLPSVPGQIQLPCSTETVEDFGGTPPVQNRRDMLTDTANLSCISEQSVPVSPLLRSKSLDIAATMNKSRSGHKSNKSNKSSRSNLTTSEHAAQPAATTPLELQNRTWSNRIVKSHAFDHTTAIILTLNAAFIGVQVSFELEGEPPVALRVIDYVFCVCFVVELTLRLVGYGCHYFWIEAPEKAWNWFDFFIVVLSTLDTLLSIFFSGNSSPLQNISILRVLRVVRITRVLRVIRVMKVFKDLRVLISSIGSTLKTAVYGFMLIFSAMYMFGVALTQLVGEFLLDTDVAGKASTQAGDLRFYYGSLWRSMLTLFMTISEGIDWRDALFPLFDIGFVTVALYLLYIVLMVLCVMNVLTGIFVQAAIETSHSDRDNVIQFQMMDKQRYIDTLRALFYELDESGDGKCSLEEFQAHLSDYKMEALLRSLDIEFRDALTLFEMFDADGTGEIDLDEFVTGCITMRGNAKAIHMEKLNSNNKKLLKRLAKIDNRVYSVQKHVDPKRSAAHAIGFDSESDASSKC